VIGAVVLATGLLLVLTALAAAWIPGGASFARPGISPSVGDAAAGVFAFARRGPNPLRAFVLAPIHPATWSANAAIGLGFLVALLAGAFVFSIGSAGLSTLLAGIGVVLVAIGIEGARVAARIERWRAFYGEPSRPPAHSYKPIRGGTILDGLRAEFADESRWRDVVYAAINLPLSAFELFVVGFVWWAALALLTSPVWFDAAAARGLGTSDAFGPLSGHDPLAITIRTAAGVGLLPVAASLSQLVIALHRGVVAGLLCTNAERELRRQVAQLRESRSAVLDVEASELHRIERDLHDGAQQRLVALTIDLGLAAERLEADPAAARKLILEGQGQAREALAEIRDLVRGIAPPILVDRGLVAALHSIIGRGPVPTTVVNALGAGARLTPAVERAAYFVASEALANVTKHSGAARCEVRLRREQVTSQDGASAERLVVEVWDDGRGGARLEPGGGLAGLESRVAALDGSLTVASPDGGPTTVRAEFPLGPTTPAAPTPTS
jgi:signal transduction histidine kinase